VASVKGQLALWDPPLRIDLQNACRPRKNGEYGMDDFQRWLGHWRADGTHRVFVANDRTHALAVPLADLNWCKRS
jgi:hypothetical protein